MQSAEKGETAGKLLEPGDMFGDYTVEKLLGKGGMGAVYLVRAPDGERYAVKLMFPEIASKNPDFRKRFAREAEFAMKIKHKNLISVYDVGEDPETGYCYIIMDYVPGGSVKDRLAANGALPIAEAVSIAAQIALALEVAHRYGVIHRDIKPDNIMFDADGTPKLADLGVAKFTDDEHKTTVTTTGMIIGTPAYMAPEQMMDSHHIDARADIYALGIVLYEMLTGKRPTEGSSAVELLAKALKGEALPDVRTMRPEISAAIAHVLSLMCAPKPEERPPTTLAVAQLLQQAATGQLKLPKKRPRAADARRKKRPFPVAACVMGALVLGAALFGWRAWSSHQKTTTGTTGVSPVAAVTSPANPTGTTGVSPVASVATGTTGVSPVGIGASGTPRPTAVRGSGNPAASDKNTNALYCVVDLSAGPTADKYPVSSLNAEPKGGWTDEYKTTKLVLRRIEPGTFKMCGKYAVTLTKPFYIGVFEMTQKQYELVTGENPSASKGDMRPVEKVSYDMIRGNDAGAKWPASSAVDSHSFMGKLRVRTGIDSFDLPTEAQWEYACRAGTTSPCNNGGGSEDDLKKLGRFRFNQKARGHNESDADLARHEPDGKGGYSERHTIVGLYMPNAWGLYDMHGNVWERCLDWRSDNLSSGVTDPLGASSGSSRIHRGGSWSNPANNCTSSTRYCYPPSGVNGSIGFRIVVGPDLLKERGITLPVPDNGSPAARTLPASPPPPATQTAPTARGSGTIGTTGVPPVGVGASGTPRPTAVRESDTPAASGKNTNALYCVVDLTAGPYAEKYPVSYLNAEPKGGWTDEYKTDKLVLRRIEPGSFKMDGKYDVMLTKAFYIGVFEVTQRQYELVTGNNPSASKGDMRPVEKVSYDMIRGKDAGAKWPVSSAVDLYSFMGRLRARTGIDGFDLPTDAQWEYACRAGTASKYNNGGDSEDDLKKLGRFVLNQNDRGGKESDADLARHDPDGKGGCSYRHTTVGSYQPNAWGIYDMHGNVWEWCLDWHGNLSGGVKDYVGPSSGANRVLRGGSWRNIADRCTSSFRFNFNPSIMIFDFGFRLAISPDLLKERGITPPVPNVNGRVAPSHGVLARTVVRSIEVFPHADAQNAKWKKRAPWRYTTKAPTADWAKPAFRDNTWKRTNKPVGFGKDAALMRMADRWTTSDIWLRRHFNWKAAKVTRVVFDMFHDENVEIYLNGARILEEAGWNDGWGPFEVPAGTFMSAVREGDNVLAVKVHDSGAPRYFDCGLTVEVEYESVNRKENK